MEIRHILSKLKTENGLTTEQLSKLSGVPRGTLNKLLNGETENPRGGTLKKIAGALGYPVEIFYARTEAEFSLNSLRNSGDILPVRSQRLPLLGEIAAGLPIYADEQMEIISCNDSTKGDFALRVRGDSMIDARIHDGDIVFIRSQEDVDDGEIAAVLLDNEATLKRVYHIKNGLQLIPMNSKYAPMVFTFDECDSIRILGKAVGFQSEL